MAPSPSPSKLGAERSSVKVSVSTLTLDLPPLAAAPPRRAVPSRQRAAAAPSPSCSLPARACAHADCQTDPSLLELLEAPEADAAAQTDGSLPPLPLPAPPPPPPAGTDASTQVTDEDVFEFEIAPLVRAMVAGALQRAVVKAEEQEAQSEEVARCEQQGALPPQHAEPERQQQVEQPVEAAAAPASLITSPATEHSSDEGADCPVQQPTPTVVQAIAAEQVTEAGSKTDGAYASAEAQAAADGGTAAAEGTAPGSTCGADGDSAAAAPAMSIAQVLEADSTSGDGEAAAGSSPAAGHGCPAEEAPTVQGDGGSSADADAADARAEEGDESSPAEDAAADVPAVEGDGQAGEAAAAACAPAWPEEAVGGALPDISVPAAVSAPPDSAEQASAPSSGSLQLDGATEGEAASGRALDSSGCSAGQEEPEVVECAEAEAV